MGCGSTVGKYQLGRTIGEGTFARVKVARNIDTNMLVAIKIIDKQLVFNNKLMDQVKREISTMKHLHHPNIVRIYEVIATKTKIYLVMEYVSSGRLSDKLSYLKKLCEEDARKYFQQLIDAVGYCHSRGVYHRDLKPENLLLDSKGNLKVSDFGLSIWHRTGNLLSTACGSPSYVAPEVINNKNYDGSPADVWSCGVILFELLAGYLPFTDQSLPNLYRKILRAEYIFPHWFTLKQRRLIFSILDLSPTRRMSIAQILEDEWFQTDYNPSVGFDRDRNINVEDEKPAVNDLGGTNAEKVKLKSPSFINAFELIAMSNDLDLSGLFEEKENEKKRTRLGSENSIQNTIEKIEVAAEDAKLSVERTNSSKVKLRETTKLIKCRSYSTLSAEVIEVTPTHCVVEISKSAGELEVYKEFCRSLSSLLAVKSETLSKLELAQAAALRTETPN